ncbi:hypothetical protein [Streptomyces niveus]|uniref:hypothetical protein n=1 Tax=Streptomyces niveus TaxID=193462 RepID=UPI00367E9A7D
MSLKKRSCLRAAVSLVGAACLAAVSLTPAHAAIPGAGAVFQIQTQFEGKTVCVSAPFDNGGGVLVFPLLPCDKANTDRQWRRSANGRAIENVRSGDCLDEWSASYCGAMKARPGPELKWRQDDQGRVWKRTIDSISKDYWGALRHQTHGAMLDFPGTQNGTVPPGARTFAFPASDTDSPLTSQRLGQTLGRGFPAERLIPPVSLCSTATPSKQDAAGGGRSRSVSGRRHVLEEAVFTRQSGAL